MLILCCSALLEAGKEVGSLSTTIAEAKQLYEKGYREVTLLGQNVDSYRWNINKKGEIEDTTIPTTNFAQLLEMVAKVAF